MLEFFHRWRVWQLCTMLVAAIVLGTLAMIAVYALPSGPMLHHAQKSAAIYETEGIGYSWAPGKHSASIDNWTNSLGERCPRCHAESVVTHAARTEWQRDDRPASPAPR